MADRFDLIIDADHASRSAVLRLLDGRGQPLAGEHRVDFSAIPAGQAQGLFDLRNYLRLYVAEDAAPLTLAPDEDLRVLFVFAEARGSLPLGSRRERRALLRLFEREIYPKRRVVAHWLSHGVTRERLQAQVREHGGYHLVHWSGQGHLNRLELARPDGSADHLSGRQILDLFLDAGGLLPRLVVLSACHSGDILRVRDWEDFLAIAAGKAPKPEPPPASATDRQGTGPTPVPLRDLDLAEQPG